MAKTTWKHGRTSNTVRVFIQDSSVTTGAGLTGVVYTSTGLVIDLIADNSATTYHYKSAATATIEDITTIGTYSAPTALNCRFKPVDATNFPGLYEIQFLDGLFDDSGATSVIGKVSGVADMVPTFFEIQLVAYDPDNAADLGVTALTGHTPQTGDNYARLGAPAGASVSADIAVIEGQTDDIGVAGAGLTAVPWNASWDAEVQSECADALTAYDPPTKAELDVLGTAALATEAKQDILDTNVDTLVAGVNVTQWLGSAAATPSVAGVPEVDITHVAGTVVSGGTPDVNVTKVAGTTQTAGDLAALITTLDTVADAIKVITDALPDSGALTSIAQGSALTTVDGVVDAIKVVTDALGATAAARLALSSGQMIPATVDTVTNTHTPTTTEFQADDVTEATTSHYNGRIVIFTSGALTGQATDITAYSAVGGIGQFTVTGMTDAPANDDTFIII